MLKYTLVNRKSDEIAKWISKTGFERKPKGRKPTQIIHIRSKMLHVKPVIKRRT